MSQETQKNEEKKTEDSKESQQTENAEKQSIESEQTDEIPKFDDAGKDDATEKTTESVEPVNIDLYPENELLEEIDQETMDEIERELDEVVQEKLGEIEPQPEQEAAVLSNEIEEEVETVSDPEPKEKHKEYHHYYNQYDYSNRIHTLAGRSGGSGGYGAILFRATDFGDASVLLAGVRGMWVINRSFGIGVEANGILPVSKFDNIDPEGFNQAILVGGYGGLSLEPIFWSNSVIHFTFPVSFGGGWMGYIEDWQDKYYYYNAELYDQDVFWYVEPGANLEFNIASFFRIDLGVSKRFTYDLNLIQTDQEAFDNWNYTFTMKFGGF
jgi:hypothetical protein